MGIWKAIGLLLGANLLTGGAILDGGKGGIGCGWVVIFSILPFLDYLQGFKTNIQST